MLIFGKKKVIVAKQYTFQHFYMYSNVFPKNRKRERKALSRSSTLTVRCSWFCLKMVLVQCIIPMDGWLSLYLLQVSCFITACKFVSSNDEKSSTNGEESSIAFGQLEYTYSIWIIEIRLSCGDDFEQTVLIDDADCLHSKIMSNLFFLLLIF